MMGWDTAPGLGVRALDLYVPGNTTGLVLEVVWKDPVQDLDAEMHAPSDAGSPDAVTSSQAFTCEAGQTHSNAVFCNPAGHVGAPDSPSRIIIDRQSLASFAKPCQPPIKPEWGKACGVWSLGFRSKDANAMLHWDLYATVFMTGDVPQGYTAVPT